MPEVIRALYDLDADNPWEHEQYDPRLLPLATLPKVAHTKNPSGKELTPVQLALMLFLCPEYTDVVATNANATNGKAKIATWRRKATAALLKHDIFRPLVDGDPAAYTLWTAVWCPFLKLDHSH
jgi:hypothetical protein